MTRSWSGTGLVTLLAVLGACSQTPLRPTAPAPAVPPDQIEHSVFFIGDAGVPDLPTDPVLVALRADLAERPARGTVVFLGDNIYPLGMPAREHENRAEAERRIGVQIESVPPGARGVFLLGNHDWRRGRDGGWDAALRQGEFVAAAGRPRVAVLPGGGCPGPHVLDLSPHLRLVILDTQWWLHSHERPEDPTSECVADSMGEITDSLRRVLGSAGSRTVLVAGHHPLATGGVHGGRFDWKDHVFPLRAWKNWMWLPLPIIGSLYPLVRGSGFSKQDLSSGTYQEMRDSLLAAFAGRPLAYAAGHEHNLQVLDGAGVRYLLVSGSGAYDHLSKAFREPETRYARAAAGYLRVDVLTDGRVRLGVLVATRDGRREEDFSMWLEADAR